LVTGEYDKLAISYGYKPLDVSENLLKLHPTLQAMVDLNMPFSTDEDGSRVDGADAYASAWDMVRGDKFEFIFIDQN
jgi:hypothetical protein